MTDVLRLFVKSLAKTFDVTAVNMLTDTIPLTERYKKKKAQKLALGGAIYYGVYFSLFDPKKAKRKRARGGHFRLCPPL